MTDKLLDRSITRKEKIKKNLSKLNTMKFSDKFFELHKLNGESD